MSEVRIVDLEKLGVDIDTFDKIYSMGEEDGRTDAIAEISREMRMLYGNEYEKQIRADAIDECIAEINKQFKDGYGFGVTVYPHTICNILEQLKEKK